MVPVQAPRTRASVDKAKIVRRCMIADATAGSFRVATEKRKDWSNLGFGEQGVKVDPKPPMCNSGLSHREGSSDSAQMLALNMVTRKLYVHGKWCILPAR